MFIITPEVPGCSLIFIVRAWPRSPKIPWFQGLSSCGSVIQLSTWYSDVQIGCCMQRESGHLMVVWSYQRIRTKFCMHKSMQALHVHFYFGHRPGRMIDSAIYDSRFSASRKTASRGMTVGETPAGVPGPLEETQPAFARRTRSAWWLFNQPAPPL
jgi:hypothetical protein